MRRRGSKLWRIVLLAMIGGGGLALLAGQSGSALAAERTPLKVVARGLNNPRGLAFGPEGALYVTEAGRGGAGPCITSPEGDEQCYGTTGAITRIAKGEQQRIVTGLPSFAGRDGGFAGGVADIAFNGRGQGHVVFMGTMESLDGMPKAAKYTGHLMRMDASGELHDVSDLIAYERHANPDGGELDSDPYGVLVDGNQRIVADAAGNDLLRVEANGKVSTLAVFPTRRVEAPAFLGLPPGTMIPMQPVPTSVVRGPDGAYYVGELTGFPFPEGAARVYRVVPGHAPQVYASGFTNIIDLAFDKSGALYVLEISQHGLTSNDATGALIKVKANGGQQVIASEGLVAPTGLAIGPDGDFYVSNYGVFAGQGQVVRIAH